VTMITPASSVSLTGDVIEILIPPIETRIPPVTRTHTAAQRRAIAARSAARTHAGDSVNAGRGCGYSRRVADVSRVIKLLMIFQGREQLCSHQLSRHQAPSCKTPCASPNREWWK
jgi:hypothetical protein